MTQEMKTKRQALKELSAAVKAAVKEGAYNSVNEGLADCYKQQGHTELRSFKRWLETGFVVRKGEKALLLWGEPRKSQPQEKQEGKDEYEFFPVAYVFSEKQVEKLNK